MTLKTRIFTHHPRISLARFTFCWWRHNRLAMTSQWPDNCDANTWQVISNLLDIDFIHGDIHGRSCKNIGFCPKSQMFLREPSPMSVLNLIKLTRKLRDLFFCCHWMDPSETSSRRLTQMKRRCQFSSRYDILGGRWSLVIMVMGAESVGSRPWSQMTCRQSSVQIGRKLKEFLGLSLFCRPGRRRLGRWSLGPAPC